ncbi:alpha-glucosidase [Spirosoma utsteinense]|uniref:Oligo-1,6-glucosidase n=1 Tax=Spirosoma utsteinense TaxID=2585773 RepID=A0ABR6WBT9_9BACT|nr:alpha-glucosidase [Spirosoma utsteinense]MBC3787830.1 oligo-1,6-glucosidase [Spirosoma utsteinense]MBC3793618.1 oligo-1,6-glucosidase [Spirosoma utsteinense]
MPDFKQQVIYQIYPRSFADSNGDGIGDLPGIISKLDYMADLGVDILWLSPIFPSPNADNGYDISDYEGIMPEFGTMADFDTLLAGVHQRGMRLILDLVVNHSSDEHRWFRESRKSKDNPYRDYYIWRAPSPPAPLPKGEGGKPPDGLLPSPMGRGAGGEGTPPNNWQSIFSGPAWKFDEITGDYYLHLFAEKQPDLNWENPKLRQEIYTMMRFWLDKGVDGFRMDVIPFLSKDQRFPDYPEGRFGDVGVHANGPRIHEFLQEMHREVLSRYPDVITVGEGIGVSAGQANRYVGQHRHELEMIYHFDHAMPRDEQHFIDPAPEFTLPELKTIFATWDRALETGPDAPGWQNIYFGNHDNPRVLSRFGDPDGPYAYESATMLATLLLTHRGTPSIYQGDEIGMTNCRFDSIDEFDDIQVKNAWKALITPTNDPDLGRKFLKAVNRIARDHARTPMQWSDAPNAGFTSGPATWLKVNPNYPDINVAKQQAEERSVLNYYRQLLHVRRQTPALQAGTYRDQLPNHPTVWLYERLLGEERLIVVANVSQHETDMPIDLTGTVVLANYASVTGTLRPFEARILLERA